MAQIRAVEIDPATGLFVGDLPNHPDDVTGPHIVTTLPPEGFFIPRWDGTQWVEGKPQSEIDAIRAQQQAKADEIAALKNELRQDIPSTLPNLTARVEALERLLDILMGIKS